MHLHAGEEVIRILSGEAVIRVGDERRPCRQGDLAIIPRTTRRRGSASTPPTRRSARSCGRSTSRYSGNVLSRKRGGSTASVMSVAHEERAEPASCQQSHHQGIRDSRLCGYASIGAQFGARSVQSQILPVPADPDAGPAPRSRPKMQGTARLRGVGGGGQMQLETRYGECGWAGTDRRGGVGQGGDRRVVTWLVSSAVGYLSGSDLLLGGGTGPASSMPSSRVGA